MSKFETKVIKSHPNLFEEKLDEAYKDNWRFIYLFMEQQVIQSTILSGEKPTVITNYVLIFEREITN
jgi:hypothetical protein